MNFKTEISLVLSAARRASNFSEVVFHSIYDVQLIACVQARESLCVNVHTHIYSYTVHVLQDR